MWHLVSGRVGSEFCAGYTDILGIWNDGFFCPSQSGTNNKVLCCGTSYHKYCCTKQDQVLDEALEASSVTLIIAIMVAVSSLLLVATIISCVCCPQCPNYDKSSIFYRQEKQRVYRLQSGEGRESRESRESRETRESGASKTVSLSNGSYSPVLVTELREARRPRQASLEGSGLSHSYTLPHSLSHHSSFRIKEELAWGENVPLERKYGTVGRKPREQPPAYHILPRSSYLVLPQDTPDLLTGTMMQEDIQEAARHSASLAKVDIIDIERTAEEEDIYQSTKF